MNDQEASDANAKDERLSIETIAYRAGVDGLVNEFKIPALIAAYKRGRRDPHAQRPLVKPAARP